MKKRVVSLLVVLCLVLGLVPATVMADDTDEMEIVLEVTQTGTYEISIEEPDESSSYKGYIYVTFTPSVTGYYSIYSTGDLDVDGLLTDSEGSRVDVDDDSGEDDNFLMEENILVAGETYYIRIEYSVALVPADIGLTIELEDEVDSIYEIEPEGSYDVAIEEAGEYLYISFVASADEPAYIYTEGDVDTVGYLYDSNWERIRYNDDGGEDYNFWIDTGTLTAGETYYLAIRLYDSSLTADFTLVIHMHNLTAVAEVEPVQCESDGTEAYWICETCGKLYSNSSATSELDEPVAVSAHAYEENSFTVADDYSGTCTVTFVCSDCGDVQVVEGYLSWLDVIDYSYYRYQLYARVDFYDYEFFSIVDHGTSYAWTNNVTDVIYSDYDIELAVENSASVTGTIDVGKVVDITSGRYSVSNCTIIDWVGDLVAVSSDESVATVEVDGIDLTITAVGEGTATIYLCGYYKSQYVDEFNEETFDEGNMVALTVTVSESASYSVIASETSASYTLGSGTGAVIAVDADIDNFTGVSVAGTALTKGTDYTVAEDSTVITFTESYLETLEPGTYDVEISFTTGTAVTSITIAEASEGTAADSASGSTSSDEGSESSSSDSAFSDNDDSSASSDADSADVGDYSDLALWFALVIIAAASLACVSIRKRFN